MLNTGWVKVKDDRRLVLVFLVDSDVKFKYNRWIRSGERHIIGPRLSLLGHAPEITLTTFLKIERPGPRCSINPAAQPSRDVGLKNSRTVSAAGIGTFSCSVSAPGRCAGINCDYFRTAQNLIRLHVSSAC